MSLYDLPNFDLENVKKRIFKNSKLAVILGVVSLVVAGSLIGFFGSVVALDYFPQQMQQLAQYLKVPDIIAPSSQLFGIGDKETSESTFILLLLVTPTE